MVLLNFSTMPYLDDCKSYQMSRISKGCSLFSNVMSLLRKHHIIPNTAFKNGYQFGNRN